jgi:hypothetical protein
MGHKTTMCILTLKKHVSFANIFKTICIILTTFLIYEELLNYTVTKPTTTSSKQAFLDITTFPEIRVCMDPAWDPKAVARHGYMGDYFYRGSTDGDTFVGWNGVGGGDQVVEDILSFHTDQPPFYKAYFTFKNKTKARAEISFKSPVYPYGRCVVVTPLDGITHMDVAKLSIYMHPDTAHITSLSSVQPALQVFFRDPINSVNLYARHDKPIRMKYTVDDMGNFNYHQYNIKISQSFHVHDDPLFGCTMYNANHSYNTCVQTELIALFEEMLGCAPPFVSGNYNNICNTVFNLTKEAEIAALFWSIYYGAYKPETCKMPCTQTAFDEHLMFKVPTSTGPFRINDFYELSIIFIISGLLTLSQCFS